MSEEQAVQCLHNLIDDSIKAVFPELFECIHKLAMVCGTKKLHVGSCEIYHIAENIGESKVGEFSKGQLFTKIYNFLHAEMNAGCNVCASSAETAKLYLPKQPFCSFAKNFDPSILPIYMVLIVLWVIIV